MTRNIIDAFTVGKYFEHEDGSIWQLIGYCKSPTATMKKVGSNVQRGGAIGCPNLDGFTRLDEDQERIVETIEKQKEEAKFNENKI